MTAPVGERLHSGVLVVPQLLLLLVIFLYRYLHVNIPANLSIAATTRARTLRRPLLRLLLLQGSELGSRWIRTRRRLLRVARRVIGLWLWLAFTQNIAHRFGRMLRIGIAP
jgi:hypothetical protein